MAWVPQDQAPRLPSCCLYKGWGMGLNLGREGGGRLSEVWMRVREECRFLSQVWMGYLWEGLL